MHIIIMINWWKNELILWKLKFLKILNNTVYNYIGIRFNWIEFKYIEWNLHWISMQLNNWIKIIKFNSNSIQKDGMKISEKDIKKFIHQYNVEKKNFKKTLSHLSLLENGLNNF